MKDEKNFAGEGKEERVIEKQSAQKDYTQNELNDELEKLAQTFREELEKAKELSDEEFEEVYADELGIIPDTELCECCGERRKDSSRGESYQYCSVCRENMKSYPIGLQNIIVALALVFLAIASIFTYTQDFYAYSLLNKAQKSKSESKIDSALKYYDSAIEEFSGANINCKNAYLQSAELLFKTMDNGTNSMYEVAQRISKALTEFETKLPVYQDSIKLREESLVLYGTMQEFYNIASKEEYAEYDIKNDEMYEAVMTEIGSLVDKEISVVSVDGETTQMLPANDALVRFCQYMFAYSSEHYEDSYKYMLETKELAPEYYWLYAYELAMAELQSGDVSQAKSLAKELISQNIEDSDAYGLYSSAERVSGNFENAVKWTDKGLSYNKTNAELMRYKAMALCCQGEFEEAKTVIDDAKEQQEYALLYFTAMVIENELGNNNAVKEYRDKLKEEEVELPQRMKDYFNGKLTAKQLFTEGTGEVQ